MTDDIQKVREAATMAYIDSTSRTGELSVFSSEWDAFILDFAKRLQPRPAPEKRVWSVSEETADSFRHDGRFDVRHGINAIAPDVIRERPDLVAAEWERRAKASPLYGKWPDRLAFYRANLFPELDP